MSNNHLLPIKAIIGLGNLGPRFTYTRHNIGFRIVEALAKQYRASWTDKDMMLQASIPAGEDTILLIKPTTFMNNSGKVIPFLHKKGIKPEEILVVHDELELPFGKIAYKLGGSHKGHNGLRSIIEACGANFHRLRFGIGRPAQREDVPDYVLEDFKQVEDVEPLILEAVRMIENMVNP